MCVYKDTACRPVSPPCVILIRFVHWDEIAMIWVHEFHLYFYTIRSQHVGNVIKQLIRVVAADTVKWRVGKRNSIAILVALLTDRLQRRNSYIYVYIYIYIYIYIYTMFNSFQLKAALTVGETFRHAIVWLSFHETVIQVWELNKSNLVSHYHGQLSIIIT